MQDTCKIRRQKGLVLEEITAAIGVIRATTAPGSTRTKPGRAVARLVLRAKLGMRAQPIWSTLAVLDTTIRAWDQRLVYKEHREFVLGAY